MIIQGKFKELWPHRKVVNRLIKNKATRSPEISREQVQKLTPQF